MLDLFVQSLALARLLRLLTEEEGPWKILEKFRAAIGINAYGGYDENRMLAGLFSCFLCLSIWVAPIVTILYVTPYTQWIVWCLAVSQTGCLIYSLMNHMLDN